MMPELFWGPGGQAAALARAALLLGGAPSGHPDVQLVVSERGALIGIDRVRAVLLWARYGPSRALHKVAIIGPAERLTQEASSALLKILEEAPPYLALLLFAEAPDRVLPTVRSRCAVVWAPTLREVHAARLRAAGYDEEETAFLLWLAHDREEELASFLTERRRPLEEWAQAEGEAQGLPLEELAARFPAYVGDPVRRRAVGRALIQALSAVAADQVLAVAERLAQGGPATVTAFLWELLRFLVEEADEAWPGLSLATRVSWARKASLARGEVEDNANARLLAEVVALWPRKS